MIIEYIVFFTLVPAILITFIKLTMPPHLRTIKITLEGLNAGIEEMMADGRSIIRTITDQHDKPL